MTFKKHAVAWDLESPTPAQLKEFFAQIDDGRVKRANLQNFLRRCDPEGSSGAHHYATDSFFHFLVNGLGPSGATDMILQSTNVEWMMQLAGVCMNELSSELKEKLAEGILYGGSWHDRYRFASCVKGVSHKTREKLLEGISQVSESSKAKILANPPVGW